jgi:hypothetical protein
LGAGVFAVLFYISKSSTHVGPLPHKNGAKMSPLYKIKPSKILFYKVFSGEREGALFFKKVPPRIISSYSSVSQKRGAEAVRSTQASEPKRSS